MDENRIRVLFIASDNTKTSGAFRSMTSLIKILQRKYRAECLVVLPWHGDGEDLLKENSINYIHVQSYPWIIGLDASLYEKAKIPAKKIINSIAVKQIKKVCKSFQPTIVHINTTWSYVGAIAAYQLHIPCVWHLRELLEEGENCRIWNREKGYSVISKADKIIAISEAVRNKYIEILPPQKLFMIYNGIDVDRFYCANRELFLDNPIKFLCVGGLHPGKDQRIIINACKLLYDKGYKDFRLDIVGIGPEEERLKELTDRNGLSQIVNFRGYSNTPEQFYKNADIVFMVSKAEAFGRVTVEAMLSGAFVIGSDSGATTELIKNGVNGFLYQPGSEKSLCEAIVTAITHQQETREMARKAQEKARSVFTAENNAQQVYEVYQEILGESVRT